MPDHQDQFPFPGQGVQLRRLIFVQGHRLFDIDVLAGGKGLASECEVGLSRCRDHHAVDIIT